MITFHGVRQLGNIVHNAKPVDPHHEPWVFLFQYTWLLDAYEEKGGGMDVKNQEKWKKRGVIRQILKDHFHGFMEMHGHHLPKELHSSIIETVNKAIRCGTRDMGYARYECKGCTEGTPEPVFICFTCKSRFCHGCGKKYTVEWAEKQQERILNVPHRHMVFTVPQELRTVFFQDRGILNELSTQVAKVIQYYYRRKNKSKKYEVGVITVIHTFGRDLKFTRITTRSLRKGRLTGIRSGRR